MATPLCEGLSHTANHLSLTAHILQHWAQERQKKHCRGWNMSLNCIGRKGAWGNAGWSRTSLSLEWDDNTAAQEEHPASHSALTQMDFPFLRTVHTLRHGYWWGFWTSTTPHPLSCSLSAAKLCKSPINLAKDIRASLGTAWHTCQGRVLCRQEICTITG